MDNSLIAAAADYKSWRPASFKARRRKLQPWRRPRGANLIEVIVAIGVVAVGVLALLSVFITGTRSNQHGEDLSRAAYYARKISETIRQENLAFTQGGPPPTIPPQASTGLNDPVGTFRPLDYRGSSGSGPIELAHIRVAETNPDGTIRLVAGVPVLVPGDTKFQRSIQIRRASNVATAYNYNVLIMDVTIRWQGGKSGDGMRRVRVSSLLRQSGET